jgi:hypothetical protein
MFRSIRVRMIAVSLLILLTALASVAATTLFVFDGNNRHNIQEELASVSVGYSLAIDQWLGARLAGCGNTDRLY